MGGTGSHDSSEDGCSVTLKCHTDTGELYNVGFKREKVTVSSDEADSILTTIETWADTVNRPETNLFFRRYLRLIPRRKMVNTTCTKKADLWVLTLMWYYAG